MSMKLDFCEKCQNRRTLKLKDELWKFWGVNEICEMNMLWLIYWDV